MPYLYSTMVWLCRRPRFSKTPARADIAEAEVHGPTGCLSGLDRTKRFADWRQACLAFASWGQRAAFDARLPGSAPRGWWDSASVTPVPFRSHVSTVVASRPVTDSLGSLGAARATQTLVHSPLAYRLKPVPCASTVDDFPPGPPPQGTSSKHDPRLHCSDTRPRVRSARCSSLWSWTLHLDNVTENGCRRRHVRH